MKRSETRNGQRGQTLLEFALVAPLLLVFVFILVDFGIAVDRRVVLDHAAREGARYASVGGNALASGTPSTKPTVVARTMAQAQGIPDAVDVCYVGSDQVRVIVQYDYNLMPGLVSFLSPDSWTINMDATANARVEQPLSGVGQCPPS